MTASELLTGLIRRRVPRADVAVIPLEDKYAIRVVSDHFQGADTAERQSIVYKALDRAPLELVARISNIECFEF